jgi:hypothetical protein
MHLPFWAGCDMLELEKAAYDCPFAVEAEYVAQAQAATEAMWLCTFISEIHNEPGWEITISSDNQEAIALSKDNKFHTQTKHINV